ncbi:glycosyltransferase [Spirosoma linguale]|uniref:Glycosyl transferase family 2 n=1 Tax=Spirosoma linguale (strain ATCC 33905 / DSM 74 / LMG 10896 / Claus 1) TaxID=504472 RepID=D2QHD8_SPILD|nr:glycosyl transferase family 2 [Spirosoma linguale DSM 74]
MNESPRPSISIALCTYNGMAYLPVQWQSLLEQQQLPDEIVICDDQSTDGTDELLTKLAADAPFAVRVLENTVRLGSNKNFERALSACTGDLIFLCDQDDFWLPEKIATMTRYMTEHPEAQVAFCDAWVTDEQLQEKKGRFWEVVRFDKKAQDRWQTGESLEVLLDGNRMMGCATVVRKSFLNVVLPVPGDLPADYIYDGWMALVAATSNAVHFIDAPLQLYRTHVQQQVGVREKEAPESVRLQDRLARRRAGKLAPLREKQLNLSKISQLLSERVPVTAPGLSQLRRRLAHFTMRSSLPNNRLGRVLPVLRSLQHGNYNRYADASANWYAPYLAMLGDLLE